MIKAVYEKPTGNITPWWKTESFFTEVGNKARMRTLTTSISMFSFLLGRFILSNLSVEFDFLISPLAFSS